MACAQKRHDMQGIGAVIARVLKFDDHAHIQVKSSCLDLLHDGMTAVFTGIDKMKGTGRLSYPQGLRSRGAKWAVTIIDKPHVAFAAFVKISHLCFKYFRGCYSILPWITCY